MSNRRPAHQLIQDIFRDARVRGYNVVARALNYSVATVQKWTLHPDDREVQGGGRSPVETMETLCNCMVSLGAPDIALGIAAHSYDLAFDACLSRGFQGEALAHLDRLADRAGKVLVDELPEIKQATIAGVMKETGEACVALCRAIDRETANLEQIAETEQEVREAIEQLQTVYNRLQRAEARLREQQQKVKVVK